MSLTRGSSPSLARHARDARHLRARLVALAALSALAAAPALAQPRGAIAGTVISDASGQPLAGASVTVRGRATPALTDSAGRFNLADVPTGTLIMQVKAVGFASASRIVDIEAGKTLSIDVALGAAQDLPEVLVKGQQPRVSHRFDEFEQRRQNGRGQYLTRAEIEKSNAGTLTDLLRRLRGTQVDCQGGGCFVRMARSPMGCLPQYIVDSRPQPHFGPGTPLNDIQGIEVYTGSSETPAEYAGEGGCGTIVIWTKSSP